MDCPKCSIEMDVKRDLVGRPLYYQCPKCGLRVPIIRSRARVKGDH